MIEREIVSRQILEHQVKEFIMDFLSNGGVSKIDVKRTPLGEKIIIYTSRPGIVVGRSGKNIKELTEQLSVKFDLDNPQVEIAEVPDPYLDANIVAESIISALERYGAARFKSIIHRAVENTMVAGAKGIEILLSGKVPSQRARTWRVSSGYLKKCGEPAIAHVDVAYRIAKLKSGVVGVIVKIMPPDVELPDTIKIKEENKEEKSEKEPESTKETQSKDEPKKEQEKQEEKQEKEEQEKNE